MAPHSSQPYVTIAAPSAFPCWRCAPQFVNCLQSFGTISGLGSGPRSGAGSCSGSRRHRAVVRRLRAPFFGANANQAFSVGCAARRCI